MSSFCLPSHWPLQEFSSMYQAVTKIYALSSLVWGTCTLIPQPDRLWLGCAYYSLDQDKPGVGVLAYLVGLNFWICFSSPPSLQWQQPLFWTMFMTAWGSLSPVQDYLTGSVNWGWGRVFNLVLVRYSFLHPKVSVPHVLLVLRPWKYLVVWTLSLSEPQCLACLTLFVVLCVLLNKFYCFSFRTRFGWLAASLDKLEEAGAYQHGQVGQELKQLVLTCWLLKPGPLG